MNYLRENKSIKATVIADHWKSLEYIDQKSDLLKNKKTICLIHSKEINLSCIGTKLNKRMVTKPLKNKLIL